MLERKETGPLKAIGDSRLDSRPDKGHGAGGAGGDGENSKDSLKVLRLVSGIFIHVHFLVLTIALMLKIVNLRRSWVKAPQELYILFPKV